MQNAGSRRSAQGVALQIGDGGQGREFLRVVGFMKL